MALRVAGIRYDLIEISLRDKPPHMIRVSPKGTVPVLCLRDGEVIDESLDIMHWALSQHDPGQWLKGLDNKTACHLLTQTDGPFKQALDQYKYASRSPDTDPIMARDRAMQTLIEPLNLALGAQPFIGGQQPVLQDIAIFPFVRQFAGVDPSWFERQAPESVRRWLGVWVESELFKTIMQKQPPNQSGAG